MKTHEDVRELVTAMLECKAYLDSWFLVPYPEKALQTVEEKVNDLFGLSLDHIELLKCIGTFEDLKEGTVESIIQGGGDWLRFFLNKAEQSKRVAFFTRLFQEKVHNKDHPWYWNIDDLLKEVEVDQLIYNIVEGAGLSNIELDIQTKLQYARSFFMLSQHSHHEACVDDRTVQLSFVGQVLSTQVLSGSRVSPVLLGAACYFSNPTKKQMMESVHFKEHKIFCESFFLELCRNKKYALSILTHAHENEIQLLKYMVKNADKSVYNILLNDSNPESFKQEVKQKLLDPLFKDYEFIESIEGKMFVSNYLKYFNLDDIDDVDKKNAFRCITSWVLEEKAMFNIFTKQLKKSEEEAVECCKSIHANIKSQITHDVNDYIKQDPKSRRDENIIETWTTFKDQFSPQKGKFYTVAIPKTLEMITSKQGPTEEGVKEAFFDGRRSPEIDQFAKESMKKIQGAREDLAKLRLVCVK